MKLRIYISGASRETEFRKYVKKKFGNLPNIELIDPLDEKFEDVKKRFSDSVSHIYLVRRDKMLLDSCHIVVCYITNGPTWGTTMEIMYAYMKGIPVFAIDGSPNFQNANNPWCKSHIKKYFSNVDDCFNFILKGE